MEPVADLAAKPLARAYAVRHPLLGNQRRDEQAEIPVARRDCRGVFLPVRLDCVATFWTTP
jgi:hypothetical protein